MNYMYLSSFFCNQNEQLCNQDAISIYESVLESLVKRIHLMFMDTDVLDNMMGHHPFTYK
jgi:hypothetical protein